MRAPRARLPWRGAWTAGLLVVALGCSTTERRAPRVPEGELVDPDLARAATEAGDWEMAAARWNELFLRGGEGADEACLETARALLMLGDAESSRGVLELGLRRDPDHPDLLEMHGNVLAQLGFRRAAETSYEKALKADPDRSSTMLELARVRLDLEQAGAALQPLERRIELGADDPETFVLYGRALTLRGEYAEAFAAFDQAFVLGLDDPRCLVAGAALYFDEDLRKDPDYNERAVHWLLRAVYRDPQLTQAHYYLGLLHEDAGRDGQALMRYRRAAESDPSHAPSLYRMAVLYDRAGDSERARDAAQRALEFEHDPRRRSELEALLETETPEPHPR